MINKYHVDLKADNWLIYICKTLHSAEQGACSFCQLCLWLGSYQPVCRPLLLCRDMVWQIERTVLSKEGLHRSSAAMSTLKSPALLGLQSCCGAIVDSFEQRSLFAVQFTGC